MTFVLNVFFCSLPGLPENAGPHEGHYPGHGFGSSPSNLQGPAEDGGW